MAKRSRSTSSSRADVSPAASGAESPWQFPLQIFLLVAAVLCVYWPAVYADWWSDDNFYYLQNPLLNDPARLWKAWFVPGSFVEYYPLHQTVQWIQWQLWHRDTFGYHVTNIALHLVNALLVWRLLAKLGLRYSWVGALLFALHPLQVESVAWITELKNTLSLAPFLLAACAYIDYEESQRPRDYRLALGWFVVALLAKISVFPFPFIIVLYVWWKRRRIAWPDLRASAPFFVIAFILVATNYIAAEIYTHSRVEPPAPIPLDGFASRAALIGLSFSFYFVHAIWPFYPLPMYPQWDVSPPTLMEFLPWPVMAGVLAILWAKRKTWGRHVLFALGFFALNLAPILGFIPISFMRETWVMDHFLYVPVIGMIALVIAAADDLGKRIPRHFAPIGGGVAAVVVALFASVSYCYADMFADEGALWKYTLQYNPDCWIALNNLGNVDSKEGRISDAIAKYEEALRVHPNYYLAYYNLGNMDQKTGQLDEAIEEYRAALKIFPDYDDAHNNLGQALLQQGHIAEAEEQFNAALRVSPDYAVAEAGLGHAAMQEGHLPDAVEHFKKAVLLAPNDAAIRDGYGFVLGKMGNFPAAIEQYQQALLIDPQDPTARNFMARLEALQNQTR